MESLISNLYLRGKIRTGETYRDTLRSFRRYRQEQDLPLSDLTADELQLYEAYMKQRGACPNTTSFYMRILRAVYNQAVAHGLIEQRHPFVQVYTGISKTTKRALQLADIRRLKALDLSRRPDLDRARDLFLFCFYTRGMSFVDMAHLRKTDLTEGILRYRRQKTGQQLTVRIEPCAQEIIARYWDDTSPYLLPILRKTGDGHRMYRNALRWMNTKLHEIGALIGSAVHLTTYVGRHTWASTAKQSNIPLAVISESMGHGDEKTTRIYLSSIAAEVIDEANAKILRLLEGRQEPMTTKREGRLRAHN
jgi:site-specific recombinase XerD